MSTPLWIPHGVLGMLSLVMGWEVGMRELFLEITLSFVY